MANYFDFENNNIIIDVLREIGNIGAGNAATSLANMINKKVNMKIPEVNILNFKDVPSLLGGEEIPVCGTIFELNGDLRGNIMFILTLNSAKRLANLLLPDLPVDEMGEMQISALKEIGNILSGSYVSSLAGLTNLKINMSVPSVAIDMAGAIISVPAIEFGLVGDKILIIGNDFSEDSLDESIKGYFLLIPDIESYDTLFGSLGLKI